MSDAETKQENTFANNHIANEVDQLLNTPQKPTQKASFSLGSIVLLAGILSVIAVIGYSLVTQRDVQPTSGTAPDFTINTFDGTEFTLSEQRGNIIVLNFWGSWCAPCRAEAPDLQRAYEQYQDQGVVFVGVTYLDREEDSLDFIDEFGLTYINGPDQGTRISRDMYHIDGAPETFIIDRDGTIAYFHYGPITADALADILDDLLDEENSAA